MSVPVCNTCLLVKSCECLGQLLFILHNAMAELLLVGKKRKYGESEDNKCQEI